MIHPFTWIQSWHSLFSWAVSDKTCPSLLKADLTASALTKLLIHASAREKSGPCYLPFCLSQNCLFIHIFFRGFICWVLVGNILGRCCYPSKVVAVGGALGITPMGMDPPWGLCSTWQSQDDHRQLLVLRCEQLN